MSSISFNFFSDFHFPKVKNNREFGLTVISLNDICSPISSVRKVTTAIVPSQLQAMSCFPVESHDKSRIESSNKSCMTTNGRLNEVSHTDSDLSRLPSAQQGAPRPVSVSADSCYRFLKVSKLTNNLANFRKPDLLLSDSLFCTDSRYEQI